METIERISKSAIEEVGQMNRRFEHAEKSAPIGVFDSGVGGLSVLKHLLAKLPNEDFIYLADTARVPYGNKTVDEILQINRSILNFFMSHKVKMVVMACGTSSAIAYPILKHDYRFPIISLITPAAIATLKISSNKKIGVFATIGTVRSEAYPNTITSLDSNAEVFQIACPLFVPLIEAGKSDSEEVRIAAKLYLSHLLDKNVDSIILGCTHYPHLINILKELTDDEAIFVDPAESATLEAVALLSSLGIRSNQKHKGSCRYLTTGEPTEFEELGSKLLGKNIVGVKHLPI